MQKWEYLNIACSRNHSSDWAPRFVNGQELPNWSTGPTIHEVSNQLGEQGWELVGLSTTVNPEYYRMVFKRSKSQGEGKSL